MKINIALFGPYGAGKGTQASILKEKYNMKAFDTGAVLRDNIARKTDLGMQIKEIIEKGELVPNKLVIDIVRDWVDSVPEDRNMLFDGIPRQLDQAKLFDEVLDEKNVNIKRVYISIPLDESIKRQIGRRICAECGKIYSIDFKSDTCDKCSGSLETRKENDPEIAKKRTGVFEKETIPVIDYYRNKGTLIEVDGMKTVEEVAEEIEQKIS